MSWLTQWVDAVETSLTQIGVQAAQFIPRVAAMLAILVLGYIVSKILERVATMLLRRMGFDRASIRIGITPVLDRANFRKSPAEIVGRLGFWFFMLAFTVSAFDALGMESLSRTIDSLGSYLPNVIGAVGIVVVGLLLAGIVRDAVRNGASGLGMEYARPLAAGLYIVLAVVVGTLAVSQLQIQTALISRVIEITLIALGVALALTIGWGTRDVAKNIMAGIYARDVYTPGMSISVNGDAGSVEEVGTVTTRIRSDDGQLIFVPNNSLMHSTVRGRERRPG